jgi:hypothetical protein
LFGCPSGPTIECRSSALPSRGVLPSNLGVCAEISHWWFRYEPPKADWKKRSAITYLGACLSPVRNLNNGSVRVSS